jgi:hypothetical protein
MQRFVWTLGLLSLSCSGPPESQKPPAEVGQGHAAAPSTPAAPPSTPAAPPVDTGACAADTDCAFDDACDPRRCVSAASVPASVGCEKTRPATGTCVCLERRCSLQPNADHPKVAVDTDCDDIPGCVLDRAAGSCRPGRDDDFRADRSIGPRCDCAARAPRRCEFSWVEPVPCASVDDCWVEPMPFSHPVKRPRSKKGKTFRPCKDGEVAPACAEGHCTMRAYGC